MRAPAFWNHRASLSSLALLPLSWLYGAAQAARQMLATSQQAAVPVICIGNVVAGGAGKTPVAMAIANLLSARGRRVFFLSRGYGGSQPGPLRVDPALHGAGDVGDEPLLLAAHHPTIVSRDRVRGAALAVAEGAEVIVMDDGFQNPSLHKDISLLVIDGDAPFGNGRLLPAGPLREPIACATKRADAIIWLGNNDVSIVGKPALRARIEAVDGAAWRGRDVIAFCGIGRPEKFFTTLEKIGCHIVARYAFADHHAYAHAELQALIDEGRAKNLPLLTTEKDAMRIPADLRPHVQTLPVQAVFASGELDRLLERLS